MKSVPVKILVIDDEKPIQKLLSICLAAEQYQVISAYTGEEGLREVAQNHPDLILLDIYLPDGNGFEVLQALREWSKTPVIVLSVQGAETEKIRFLDAGADDYITKPFSTGELTARIRVALRQRTGTAEESFTAGRLHIDFGKRQVKVEGNLIKLTRIEFRILQLLALHADKVVTQTQIMREVWKPGMEKETNLLRVYIANLRKKIEEVPDKPKLIVTEPAVGYRLVQLN